MKKQIGIWLDYKQAYLIEVGSSNSSLQKIESGIEDYRVKGGARSKTPWGPMDKVSESKYLERRKHQTEAYFKKIVETLKAYDELFLFGPAQAKEEFRDYLLKNRILQPVLRGVMPASQMTDNQKVAAVRDFFFPEAGL